MGALRGLIGTPGLGLGPGAGEADTEVPGLSRQKAFLFLFRFVFVFSFHLNVFLRTGKNQTKPQGIAPPQSQPEAVGLHPFPILGCLFLF